MDSISPLIYAAVKQIFHIGTFMIVQSDSALAGSLFCKGEVWLCGAGPGDPELLTLRAVQALGQADLILHDALPGRGALRHARRGAEILAVGKRKGATPVSQARINARLVAGARAGLRVLRLKGGDPFTFGRGGEEAEACDVAGITWRIIPGISAGMAAPAAAGIPITHRGMASAVIFVTAHDETGALPDLNWDALARSGGTIAAFMALSRLDELALRLLAGGLPATTPVALISQASLPCQVTLRSTLGLCTLDARRAVLATPCMIIIGAVAALGMKAVNRQVQEFHHATG